MSATVPLWIEALVGALRQVSEKRLPAFETRGPQTALIQRIRRRRMKLRQVVAVGYLGGLKVYVGPGPTELPHECGLAHPATPVEYVQLPARARGELIQKGKLADPVDERGHGRWLPPRGFI